jgi:hypothetical protein
MKICSVGAEFFHEYIQTERRTDITNLTANAPKNSLYLTVSNIISGRLMLFKETKSQNFQILPDYPLASLPLTMLLTVPWECEEYLRISLRYEVNQLVEALCYSVRVRLPMGRMRFFIDLIFPASLWP